MGTDQGVETTVTTVELSIYDWLGWGEEYEYFVDLLSDLVATQLEETDQEVPSEQIFVQSYAIVGVPQINITNVDVYWYVDE